MSESPGFIPGSSGLIPKSGGLILKSCPLIVVQDLVGMPGLLSTLEDKRLWIFKGLAILYFMGY